MNVCPICAASLTTNQKYSSATILCVWEIWSGSNNRVHVFHWLEKKIQKERNKKAHHCTNFGDNP